jgi:hypothetical protein
VDRRANLSGPGYLAFLGAILSVMLLAGLGVQPALRAAQPHSMPQTLASIPDLDPHEALGSKNAPMVMEVFSDLPVPGVQATAIHLDEPIS